MQTTQNIVLQIATGCTWSSPTSIEKHTHEQHVLLRGLHFYTSTDCTTHYLHHLWSAPARIQTDRQTTRPQALQFPNYTKQNSTVSPHTGEHITLHPYLHCLHQQNVRHLPCRHHNRQHTSQIRPPTRRQGPPVTVLLWTNPDCPHCNSAESTKEHLLLLSPTTSTQRPLSHARTGAPPYSLRVVRGD